MRGFTNKYRKQVSPLCFLVLIFYACEKSETERISVETGNILDTSTTTITVAGDIVNMGEGIATYGHIAARDNAFTLNVKKSSLSNPSDTGAYSSTIYGLLPGTSYYVRAYASNSSKMYFGDSILSFTTLYNETLDGTFTDSRDGHIYKMVTIGNQAWMAENLAYLPAVSPPSDTSRTSPRYYVNDYYNGSNLIEAKETGNYTIYGVLYNWQAAINACPSGWHLPTDSEWDVLIELLGGMEVAGGKLKESGYRHWLSPNESASNESGFTALPGGVHLITDLSNIGVFSQNGFYGYWLSATNELEVPFAWYRCFSYDSPQVLSWYTYIIQGLSVRCVKD